MAKKRAFISFDYDHDSDLKILLVGQAKNKDTPFDIADFSIKEAIQFIAIHRPTMTCRSGKPKRA